MQESKSVAKKLDSIFKKYNVPFGDGLVDEKGYAKSKTKIMFLLKEVDADEGDFPNVAELGAIFADEAVEKGRWPINAKSWWNVPKFVYAILNGFPDVDYNDIPIETLAPYVKQIAWVNLKKGAGAESSDYNDIKTAAKKEFDMWYQEIEIIKPSVILCGGTFSIVRGVYVCRNLIKKSDVRKFTYSGDSFYYFKHRGAVYFDFYHPNAKIRVKKLVKILKKFFGEAGLSK
ncbi:hypothetical protein HQ545_02880 [Candidatus Woesearchaeota archaeon]|nr:hypothetical protein [Candidatus Woesearchaeota archaeon]